MGHGQIVVLRHDIDVVVTEIEAERICLVFVVRVLLFGSAHHCGFARAFRLSPRFASSHAVTLRQFGNRNMEDPTVGVSPASLLTFTVRLPRSLLMLSAHTRQVDPNRSTSVTHGAKLLMHSLDVTGHDEQTDSSIRYTTALAHSPHA